MIPSCRTNRHYCQIYKCDVTIDLMVVLAGSAVGEHVFEEGCADATLVALAGGFEKNENLGVEAEGDLLLVLFGD
jgi:hypothetical protein